MKISDRLCSTTIYLRLSILTALLLISTFSFADITLQIKGATGTKTLTTRNIDGIEYVDFDDFNQVFKSIIKQEYSENRVYLYLYGEQFIFLLDTPYYSFANADHNMHYPLLTRASRLYVPAIFVREHLAMRLKGKISVSGRTIIIEKPVDRSVTTIVLDPGHGGKDPGAVGKTLRANEKDINLSVALKLKGMLERELGLKVLMTRSDDRFVSLGSRTRFANENKADLFVSLHTNAATSRSGYGIETYYLATSVNSSSRAVEALENNVVDLYEEEGAKQKYNALAFILSDLSQAEHLENSNILATLVQQNLVFGTKTYDRGVNQADFFVLRGAFMPAILAELGFITNEAEESKLVTAQYQERLARTIFEGIKRFKYRYDRVRNI